MSEVIESLFPIPRWNTYVYFSSIIIMFHGGYARLVYDVLRVASCAQKALSFIQQLQSNLSTHYSYLIRLIIYCGCIRYYAYCLYKSN